MAQSWKQYGPITISAAITVAVSGVWYLRTGRGEIRGQDAAELQAAVYERAIYKHTGTGVWTRAAVTQGVYIAWGPHKTALDALREYATNETDRVKWLDPTKALPANNGIVSVASGYAWSRTNTITNAYGVVERYWKYDGLASATPYFLTADTRFADLLTTPVNRYGSFAMTNVPAVKWFFDTDQNETRNFYWGGVGNYWTYLGLGTNLYLWQHVEKPTSLTAFAYSRAIQTNSFNDARTLARALRRTIRVYDATEFVDHITVTGGVLYTQGDFNHASNGNFTGQAMYQRARSEALSAATVTTNTSGAFEPQLAYIDLGAYQTEINYGGGAVYAAYGDCDFQRVSNIGVRCSYPSQAACASGLVDRVTVYAIAQGRPSYTLDVWFENPGGSGIASAGAYTNNITYTADNHPTDGYDDEPLGTGLTLATHTFEGFLRWPFLYDVYQPWQTAPNVPSSFGTVSPYIWYWTQVCDVEDPTNAPAFDLSSTLDPTTVSHNQYSKVKGYDAPPNDANYEQLEQFAFRQQIDVRYLVVIVDWKWHHLGESDFDPSAYGQTNVPAWATANTNAP